MKIRVCYGLLLLHSTHWFTVCASREVSEVFQLLRGHLLEHGHLGTILDYSANSLFLQARNLLHLFPVPKLAER